MAQVSVTYGAGAFSAKIYAQPGAIASLVPLTQAQMGSQDLTNVAVATTQITTITGAATNQLLVEDIGNFGYASAEATFGLAGNRYAAKIATQSAPDSITLTFPLNPSNAAYILMTGDANSGTTVRTYVITWLVGANTFVYAFNAFASAAGYNFATNAEAKSMITLVPQGGGQFGYSYV